MRKAKQKQKQQKLRMESKEKQSLKETDLVSGQKQVQVTTAFPPLADLFIPVFFITLHHSIF